MGFFFNNLLEWLIRVVPTFAAYIYKISNACIVYYNVHVSTKNKHKTYVLVNLRLRIFNDNKLV